VPKTKHKRIASRNQEPIAIEIDSSGDEHEEITNEMRRKPTLYHLSQIDLESVRNKNNYMRGTCVQAIIELLHAEKRREDLTCVSTDFYTLLMDNKFTEAKQLLHPDEGCHNWEKPAKKIATAESRILVLPCHAVNHWFLTIRIKLNRGKHQVIIIDSLGQKSGNGYLPKLRGKLKEVHLITKKDKCIALDTQDQTEVECGVRMATYMVLFRSMDLQQLRDGQILERLKGYVAREKSSAGNLAAQRRTNIHRLLEEEQAKVKE
jgi:Ulp1 family protease